MSTIDKIKALPQTIDTLNDLFVIAVDTKDLELNRWVRREASKIKTAESYELLRKTYVFGGRYSFDDYMIACEWYREPQAKFWLPRRKILEGKHKIATMIQEFIDSDEDVYLGFSMPPGCGKTTLIKFLLAYIDGKYPKSANMYVSYSDGMIKMMLDAEKAILTDASEYAHNDVFPENGAPDISAEYKTISHRKKGDFPTIGLVSLGGSVTGRTRANKFLVTDDLVKDKELARSPERLATLYDDYTATLTTRMIGDDVKQIQLGTIWSAHDPISRMKREHQGDPRYKFIAIPVWDENNESNFLYDHPDRYTTSKIWELKASLDPVDFSCLYLQKGIEREGLAFAEDELQYFDTLPDGKPDKICFTTDIAWGGGDSLSMPIAYVYDSSVYIVDVVFDKGDKKVTKPRVIGKILSHKCNSGRMEANNGGDEYADDVSRILKEEYGYTCAVTHKKAPTTMNKLTRIEQYVPDIKEFYFLSPKKQNDEYRRFFDEVTTFSFTTKNLHDDAPDSLAMLADYLQHKNLSAKAFKRPF